MNRLKVFRTDSISELVRSVKGIMAAENTVKYMSEEGLQQKAVEAAPYCSTN